MIQKKLDAIIFKKYMLHAFVLLLQVPAGDFGMFTLVLLIIHNPLLGECIQLLGELLRRTPKTT